MAPSKVLAQLALQKRLLLAESEAQRLVLAAEFARMTQPFIWMDRLQHRSRPLFRVAAPLATFLFARRSKGIARWVVSALGAARIYFGARRYLKRSTVSS